MEVAKTNSAIDAYGKGLGTLKPSADSGALPKPDWNLLKEEVSLPAAVMSSKTLEHNLNWMQAFISLYPNFQLAPHGKTTMCPQIFLQQIRKGAWGITLATPIQAQLAHSFGIKRILLANQLVGLTNMEIIANIQEVDQDFEFYCTVDSVKNVQALGEYFGLRGQKLRILLEYGPHGGRTGVRNTNQEMSVLNEIRNWPSLKLVGVEFYEGILPSIETVRLFVQNIVSRTLHLLKLDAFYLAQDEKVILTGSGSAWFDVVADELSVTSTMPIQVLLRPGCYVSHGVKMYQEIESRLLHNNPVDGNPLTPALTLWAYVQSLPEPNLAIVALGKRDALNDCGFPTVKMHFRPGIHSKPVDISNSSWTMVKMMDQHSYLEPEKNDEAVDLAVGDILIFDICHPCTIFDKWKYILVANEEYQVEEIFSTYF